MGFTREGILASKKRLIFMTSKQRVEVPFRFLHLQAKTYQRKILAETTKIIESGIFLNGDHGRKLEKKLSGLFSRSCIAVASGHDALLLSLQSLNLLPTDEIIFPVNAYPTAFPVFLSGATPVPCDVDENGQLNPSSVRKLITKKTKVVIMVHLYGLVGRLDELVAICRRNDIILFEDCAQAFGSKFKGKLVGTFGDIACFSFYPTKNIGTLGDGGAIIVKNKRSVKYFKEARQYGELTRYRSKFVSGHSRIPEIQAAVIGIYLNDYNKVVKKKQTLDRLYRREIIGSGIGNQVSLMTAHPKSSPVVHLFVISAVKRNSLQLYLKKHGVETLIHYPFAINHVPAFKLGKTQHYPIAERLSQSILSLPFHQYLTNKQIKYTVSLMRNFYEKTR